MNYFLQTKKLMLFDKSSAKTREIIRQMAQWPG